MSCREASLREGAWVGAAAAGRRVPDVVSDANPETGCQMFIDGSVQVVGGTSAATPLWGGLIAPLNQGLGRNVGYLNPTLYSTLGPNLALTGVRCSQPRGGLEPGLGYIELECVHGMGTPGRVEVYRLASLQGGIVAMSRVFRYVA